MTHPFTLSDGRRIQVLDAGAKGGKVLVAHHGTPSEAGLWQVWDKAASELGVRLISLTRPGYGESDGRPGRRVGDVASDVREVLDQLDVASFVTVGWSGGGPHALACAGLLKGRCLAAAALAALAPADAPGLDFLGGMGAENVQEFATAMKGEAALSDWMEREGAGYRTITAESLFAAFGSLLPPIDQKALEGELVAALAETIRLALKDGFRGWLDDDLAFVRPWGFDVSDIRVPTAVWQGDLDKMVPLAHGRWLAERIPDSIAHFGSGDGHISLVAGRERDIMRELLALSAGKSV